MSSRTGFALAVLLLLLAATLRLWDLATLPPGFTDAEITDIRLAQMLRQGRVEVFYNLEPLGLEGGRESLYHAALAVVTSLTGNGTLGYRLLSLVVGMIALALVYALGTRLHGPLAGAMALALLAVGMWPLLLARTIGRETLIPLLVAAVMLALARALPVYAPGSAAREPRTAPFAALGLLLGMGLYVHPVGFLIALGALAFIVWMIVSPRPLPRRTLSYIGFAVLVGIIAAIPYVISSIRLPELAGPGRLFGEYSLTRYPPLQTILDSLFGLFFAGDANAAHNLPGRPLLDLFSGVFVLFGLLTALRQARHPRYMLPLLMGLALLPGALFAPNAPDFSAMTGLLVPLALFFGLGVTTFAASLRGAARPALALGLAALLAFNLVWVGRDLFTTWPGLERVQQAYNGRSGALARHIDNTAGSLPTVACVPTSAPRGTISDAQRIILMMNRSETALRFADCGTGLVLTQGGERQQVIFTEPDTLARMPAVLRRWLDEGQMLTGDGLPPDGVMVMDVAQTLADQIGMFTTTAPAAYAPEAPGGAAEVFPPVRFGGNITFLGYEPDTTGTYKPGDVVPLVTYWRVDGPPPPDMRLFAHILADPASIAAQNDTISVLPRSLRARDVFIQITFVTLLESTPPGQYDVSIGAYQDSDKTRMAVLDSDDQQRGTRLFLLGRTITVAGEN